METEGAREILCVSEGDRAYAFELGDILEICPDLQVTTMPCLTRWYQGVANYKGTIIPIVTLEQPKEGQKRMEKRIVLVSRCAGKLLGIAAFGDLFMLRTDQMDKVRLPENLEESEVWTEKEVFRKDDLLVTLIDMEKSVENLVIYK